MDLEDGNRTGMDNFKGADGTLVTSNSFSNLGDFQTGT